MHQAPVTQRASIATIRPSRAGPGTATSPSGDRPGPAPVTRERFLAAMSHAVTGVNVVTTDGIRRAGATVSAMSSVSADPPMVLVCIHRQAPTCAAVRENGVFCVNVLGDGQSRLASVFAGQVPAPNGDKFACARWQRLETGAPVLGDALLAFDCRVVEARDAGTHTVFIGQVVDTTGRGGTPLLYSNRCYGRPLLADSVA